MRRTSLLLGTIAILAVLCINMVWAEQSPFHERSDYRELSEFDQSSTPQTQNMKSKTGVLTFKSTDVVQGRIRVKLSAEAAAQVERKMGKSTVLTSRSSGKLRMGVPSMETKLQSMSATSLKRVFPYHPRYEARQREKGLHLWYDVNIDESVELKDACVELSSDENVLFVEPIFKKEIRGIGGKKETKLTSFADDPQIVLFPTSETKLNNLASKTSTSPISLQTRDYQDNPPVNDPMLLNQWHYYNYGQVNSTNGSTSTVGADIKLFDAWKINMGKPNVIVSVHDEGVQTNHPDLAGNMWVNTAELNGREGFDDDNNGYIDDINGYNFSSGTARIVAGDHGAHTAGTIGAVNNNGIGVAGIAGGSGSNDGARLMGCQVFQGDESGGFAASYAYAANNGAVISQNSWGHTEVGYYQQSILDGIDYFIQYAGKDENGAPLPNTPMVGGIVIFASGNDGESGAMYPGYYEACLTVSSVGPFREKPAYTNYGSWVDISAPGGNMTDHGEKGGVLSSISGGSYAYYQGTSMACPHVSGVAALVLSEYGHESYTPEMLRNRILSSVTTWNELNMSEYNGIMGVGMLNAQKALAPDEGIAPNAITDLTVSNIGFDFGKVEFTAPADKDNKSAFSYELRYSTEEITAENFNKGKALYQTALDAGKADGIVVDKLSGRTTYYVAVKAIDIWGNVSAMSNVVSFVTSDPPTLTYSPTSLSLAVTDAIHTKEQTLVTIGNTHGGDLRYSMNYTIKKEPNSNFSQISNKLSNFDPNDTNISSGFIGSDGSDRFMAATRFNVSNSEDFVLTDVVAAVAPLWNVSGVGVYTSEKFGIKVYRGGDTPATGKLVFSASYSIPFVNYYVNGAGADVRYSIGDTFRFRQGEHFWVVFDFVKGFLNPMRIHGNTLSARGGELYSTDSNSWIDINELTIGNMQPNFAFRVFAINNQNDLPRDLITIEPADGYVTEGNKQDVKVIVDASKVEEGDYETIIHIDHNDPEINGIAIPFNFTVDGHNSGIRSKEKLSFNSVVQGYTDTLKLTLHNDSLGVLDISKIYSDKPYFTVKPSENIKILPGDSLDLTLVFKAPGSSHPDSTGIMISRLNFDTNTPSRKHSVILDGMSISRPIATMDRLSEDIELRMGESQVVEFTLKNDGKYRLDYKVDEDVTTDFDFFDADPSKKKYYGKKTIAYWASLNANNAVNITEDIRGQRYKEVALPFTFNYYGVEYDTITIAGNGNISMGARGQYLFNPSRIGASAIPATIFPCYRNTNAMVTEAGGEAYLKVEGGKVTIEYTKMGTLSGVAETETITVQVVLNADGKVEMKYKNFKKVEGSGNVKLVGLLGMSDTDGKGGLGIWCVRENPTKKGSFITGLTTLSGAEESMVVWQGDRRDTLYYYFIPPVIEYNKNTVITISPENTFAQDITPTSGSLMPGEETKISVRMGINKNLKEGIYKRTIPIYTNDPENKKIGFNVNVDFKSEAKPSVNLTEINFGEVGKSITAKAIVPVRNLGGKPFTSTAYTAGNTYFKVVETTARECAGLSSVEYTVQFTPTEEKDYEDRMVIDVVDGTPITINLKGKGVKAPKINFAEAGKTTAFTIDKRTGTADEELYRESTITITNEGEAPLLYNLMTTEWISTTNVKARSGSDKSGYFWTDNLDDKSGVRYEWIEENPIPFNPIGYSESEKLYRFSKEFELPWPFEYYGETFTKCYVNMSGMVYFNRDDILYAGLLQNASQAPQLIIPEQGTDNGYIAALGGSYDNSEHFYEIVGEGDDAKIVFTWHSRPLYNQQLRQDKNYVTFQTILHKDGSIKFQYKDVETAWWRNLTVIGIENRTGTDGLNICSNKVSYIRNGLAIFIKPSKVETLGAGQSRTINVKADGTNLWELNTSNEVGTVVPNKGVIWVKSNDPSNNSLKSYVNLSILGEIDPHFYVDNNESQEVKQGEVLRSEYPISIESSDDNGVKNYNNDTKKYVINVEVKNTGSKTLLIHDERQATTTNLAYITSPFKYTTSFPPKPEYVAINPSQSYVMSFTLFPSHLKAPAAGKHSVNYPIAIRSNLGTPELCEAAGYDQHAYLPNMFGTLKYAYSYKIENIKIDFEISDVPLETINIEKEINELVFETRSGNRNFNFEVENQVVGSPSYWNDMHKSAGTANERVAVTNQADLDYKLNVEYITKAKYEQLKAKTQEATSPAVQSKNASVTLADLKQVTLQKLPSAKPLSVNAKSQFIAREGEDAYLDSLGYFNYANDGEGYIVSDGTLTNYTRFQAGAEGFNLTYISSVVAKFKNNTAVDEEVELIVLMGDDARTADLLYSEKFTPEVEAYKVYTPIEHRLAEPVFIYPNQYFWIGLKNKANTSVEAVTWNSDKIYSKIVKNFMIDVLGSFDYAMNLTGMFTGWKITAWSDDKVESIPNIISLSKTTGEVAVGSKEEVTVSVNPEVDPNQLATRYARIQIASNDPYPYGADSVIKSDYDFRNKSVGAAPEDAIINFKEFARTRKEILVKVRMNQAPELFMDSKVASIKERQDSTFVVYVLDQEGDSFDDLQVELSNSTFADSIYGVAPIVSLEKGEAKGDTVCYNFSIKPGYESEGTYNYSFFTKDDKQNADTLSFSLTVKNKNRVPEGIGANSTTVNNGQTKTINLNKLFSDPDRQRMTYSVSSADAGIAEATTKDSILTIIGWYPGDATLKLIATDKEGAMGTLNYKVNVIDQDPSLSSVAVKLYPNPIVDVLNCDITLTKYSRVEFMVYDSTGRLCFKSGETYYPVGKHTYQIPANSLSGGVYILQYIVDGEVKDKRRFIK